MKRKNLEIMAKATTLKPFSIDALKTIFLENLRDFFNDVGGKK